MEEEEKEEKEKKQELRPLFPVRTQGLVITTGRYV